MVGTRPGAPTKPKTKPFRLAVSAELRDYLGWLSRNTLLGKADTDVASYLLTQTLQGMRRDGYTEETPPEKNTAKSES
jgi:hypothetical protein